MINNFVDCQVENVHIFDQHSFFYIVFEDSRKRINKAIQDCLQHLNHINSKQEINPSHATLPLFPLHPFNQYIELSKQKPTGSKIELLTRRQQEILRFAQEEEERRTFF
mmetsp:Transcript_28987/g.74414  ORF Transcript_28987/g.74414 Transcript_28987/m.74414 type:complete len:109 (-) Transcript_28987:395-721(-)